MTTDDFMFDLSEKEEQVITSPAPPDFPKDKVIDSTLQGKVVMRVLHTRTEIKIYPNGQTFQNSKSWFEDKAYEVKKKEKKKIGEYKKEDGVVEL